MTLPGRRIQGGWAQRNEGSSGRELVKKLPVRSRCEFDGVPCLTAGHQNFAAERNLSATETSFLHQALWGRTHFA